MLLLFAAITLAPASEAPPANTAPSPAPVSAAQAPAPAPAERKICKRDDSSSTRLGSKRICLTAEQWRARDGGLRGLGDVAE
jgi:hypothetical protein